MLGDDHSARTEKVKAEPARPRPGEEAEKKIAHAEKSYYRVVKSKTV